MAKKQKIRVDLINFHSVPCSHIEVFLKVIPQDPTYPLNPPKYLKMDIWDPIALNWSDNFDFEAIYSLRSKARSSYSFEIEADPEKIAVWWTNYWTEKSGHILGNNCAEAAQAFLTEFAQVPRPSLSNVSWNYLSFGLIWPSFLPCPVLLPGRVMSHAKFHIEARQHPEKAMQYNRLFLYTSMSLSALVFAGSMFALAMAATILSGGLVGLAMAGCIAVGLASTYCFFKARNLVVAKNIAEGALEPSAPPNPI